MIWLCFFFFNDTATTETSTLSLPDPLPICDRFGRECPRMNLHLGCGTVILPGWVNVDSQPYPGVDRVLDVRAGLPFEDVGLILDRKSTRLNSSHANISYAVFCLKKKINSTPPNTSYDAALTQDINGCLQTRNDESDNCA